MPDIIGYKLDEAEIILKEAGLTIASIQVTTPPRMKIYQYDNQFRVVKLNVLCNKSVELIVCKPL